MSPDWPLVGRDQELTAIARARSEGHWGVVVSADAGTGKSRLGREALAAFERDGAMTEWVQATRSAAMIPLGAFARLLPDSVRSDQAFNLLRDSARALEEQAAGRPIVLGVDDAQRLDPASAALVLHLASRAGVFVVATIRTGEPCPDAIVALHKDGHALRLELAPLGDAALRSMVETALDGPVEEAAYRWIVDRSQGNPLYARELVTGALAGGQLVDDRGLWRLAGRPAVAASLIELVGHRMDELSGEQRAPAELLALAEPLRLTEIEGLTSYDALADAEARGLIALDTGGDVRLAHPLYGDILRAAMPTLRCRALRLRLAAALQERRPMAPDDALRVVRLLLDAGAPIPPQLLVDAARAANLAGDPELGAQLGELAVADGGGLDAVLALARANAIRGRFDEAEAALDAVEAEVPGHPAAVAYLEQRVRILYWGIGDRGATEALLTRAAAWVDRPWRLALRMPIAVAADLAGTIAEAEATLAGDLEPESRRVLETRLAMALFYAGRWTDARRLAHRHRPPIPLQDYTALMTLPAYRMVGAESGIDWPDLAADLKRALAESIRCHDHEAAAQAAVGLAHLDFFAARFCDAERWLAEAELHFEREDAFGLIADVHMLRIGIAAATRDAAGVEEPLRRLRAHAGRDRPQPLARAAYVARAEGWAAWVRNPQLGAAQLLEGAQAFAADMPGFTLLIGHDALVAGASASRVAALLTEARPGCAAPLLDAYAAHAEAAAARDGDAVLAVADTFARIGATFYALQAATRAAACFVEDGRQDSARRAAARVRELHVAGQGTEPPVIDGLDGSAVSLTAREAQLVDLARQGLSNADIADRLVLSVRTVESHLYRAMQKLGVRDRRDL
ncbi:regulatory LuxR family protein [Solirubrobacter pauli]|uniref:Regulatory LuxR family protein n=1 Tax=Solirubrobacter pauli TaxID=166793 RepID=A0A660LIQ4_9ACTN|nr:regulatory LuxR family protein [Solirubrobacter pauli]